MEDETAPKLIDELKFSLRSISDIRHGASLIRQHKELVTLAEYEQQLLIVDKQNESASQIISDYTTKESISFKR